MNKNILLVAINAKYIHSNLAVYSLKAAAGDYSEHIHISEYTINNRVEDILDDIYMRKPGLIGFSCYIWNIEYVKKLIVEVHKLLPQCEIWLGGPEVSYNAPYYIDKYPFIRGVMAGEGEAVFKEVVAVYLASEWGENSELYEKLPGVYTANVRNPQPAELVDMSGIPFPYRDLEEFKNRIIYYESSRGCPFSCSYCLSSIDKKLRFRDVALVEQELAFFLKHQVSQVKFVDRTFNCDRERSKQIWRFISDNDNGITNFHFEISADLIDDEQIAILNSMRPGLVQLEIGVQTTNSDTIKAIRRKMNLEKLKEVVRRLNEPKNIHLHLDLIAGLPFENMASFKKSFNDVYNMKPDELQLGFLKVLHGSYMYEDARKYNIVYKDFPPYEVLRTEWMSYDDILELKKVEEVLEIYFGSGQFANSVNYLIRFFETPFDFYRALGRYYGEQGVKGAKHSRIDRYKILLEFARQHAAGNGGSIHSYEVYEDYAEHKEHSGYEEHSGCEDYWDLDSHVGNDTYDEATFKELLTFDIYVRENMKTRPEFAVDISVHRNAIKKLARKYELKKGQHIEPVSAKTRKYIDAEYKNIGHKEARCEETKYNVVETESMNYIVFDYEHRNPLNYNAKIERIDESWLNQKK